jgi:hypothetical protein
MPTRKPDVVNAKRWFKCWLKTAPDTERWSLGSEIHIQQPGALLFRKALLHSMLISVTSISEDELKLPLVLKTSPESEQLDGFLILLRSASNPRAALIWHERIEKHYEVSLSGALSGPKKKERAGLILAVIAGVQILRQAICITSPSEASPDWLIERLAHLLESVVS